MKATIATAIILAAISTAKADDAPAGVYASINSTPIKHQRVARDSNGNVIGGSPDGCPRTAFCGCALALKVFGRHVRDLWPARAWFKYPRTLAHSGAVAV